MKKPDLNFYLSWILLTSFCFPIGLVIGSFFIIPVINVFIGDFLIVNGARHITEDYLFIIIAIPVVGLLTGIIQFGLLRRYLPRIGRWVLVTFGGWLLGWLLILISAWRNSWTYVSYNLDMVVIMLGLSVGIGQWLLLRYRLLRAGWWVGANLLGWLFSGLILGKSMSEGSLSAMFFSQPVWPPRC